VPQLTTVALAHPGEGVEEAADLARLFDEHASYVRTLLRRLLGPAWGDVDDLVQEVFLVAWKRRRSARGDAVPWLRAIAIHVACGARKRARLRRFLSLDSLSPPVDPFTPHQALEQSEALHLLYAALEGLTEKRRTVLVLSEIEGLSGKEIAQTLGCPLKTVWTRLHHARKELTARYAALASGKTGGEPR
jgi:RNA polymerase sigma-70 factor (ECF subfamily)